MCGNKNDRCGKDAEMVVNVEYDPLKENPLLKNLLSFFLSLSAKVI
jgi:hypothetical protein